MLVSEFLGSAVAAVSNGTNTTCRKSGAKVPVKKKVVRKVVKKVAPKKVAPKKVVRKSGGSGSARKSSSATPENLSNWYGADRRLYLPAGLLDPADVPTYLNGELAGDYGYDPLGLGKDPETVEKYRAAELIHSRWAMLAILGCLIPEAAASLSEKSGIVGPVWWQTGEAMLDGGLLTWYGAQVPLPLALVVVAEVALMGAVENYRQKNEGPAGADLDPLYPGERFDPLGLADDPDTFAELRVKEIKNGRLALVSMLGYFVQAGVTGEGPFANWSQHLADPFGYNLFTVIGNPERVPSL